jgi:formamidopyrimidine-DNA glycosylase
LPELPEMENYKRLLSNLIIGKPISDVEVERVKSLNVPEQQFRRELIGASVQSVERRAKHLMFHLSTSGVLILHLMLGGMMFYGTRQQKPDRTAQITISWNEHQLYFIGLRLGYLHLYEPQEAQRFLRKLGPEPLEANFTQDRFREVLRAKKGTLKSTLVDQSIMAGIGNCYSDEICFEAGLRPARHVSGLQQAELGRLYQAIRHVLTEAIRYGGYMEIPLFEGDSLTGGSDSRCKVYDREGEPCTNCGFPLVRQDVSSKKSFCCLHCQA